MHSAARALHEWRASPVRVLNLGCGHRAVPHPYVINIDWSIFLRFRTSRLLHKVPEIVLSGDRLKRYRAIPDNIVAHDISRGIPLPDAFVDVVYHSHMFEHIPRDSAGDFLRETLRVLKPRGIHRIVVPDLALLVSRYMEHLDACEKNPAVAPLHDGFVAEFLEQCVRDVPAGARELSGWRRALYLRLLGDARKRGEAHRWMYDQFNLRALLESAGYRNVLVMTAHTSRIEGWQQYCLDQNPDGTTYKSDSLYMEAER